MTVAARDVYTSDAESAQIPNSAVLNVSLYYFDGANRGSLGNQDFLVAGTFADAAFAVTSIPGAAVGKFLGIEFDNVSDLRDLEGDVVHSWLGLDNVRLSVVPEPGTVALLSIGVASQLVLKRRHAWSRGHD